MHDSWVDPKEALHECGLKLIEEPAGGTYGGIVLAVAHDTFQDGGLDTFAAWRKPASILCDLKGVLPYNVSDLRL